MKDLPSLKRRLGVVFGAALAVFFAPCARWALAAEAPTITLERALDRALARHPDLAASAADFDMAEGRVLQASLRLDPELELAVSNQADETSVGISQTYELGGKRLARTRRAKSELPVLRADLERRRQDIATDVARAFTALLGAQERMRLKQEALDIATRLAATVSEQVAAGAVSPIEETRAKVALAAATTDAARAERESREARLALAQATGDPSPDFLEAAGEIPSDLSLPEMPALLESLARNPDLTRWQKERVLREAALESERAAAATDVTLKGTYAYDRTASESIFTVGVTIPLRVRDKNQGAIAEAAASLAKVGHEARSEELRLRSQLAQRYAALAGSAREARILKDEALAGAQQAYDAVSEGYRQGKFRYLDVLDAGNALIETKLRYLDSLVEVELARVDLKRLIGAAAPATETPEKL